jgi:hypothetical protein
MMSIFMIIFKYNYLYCRIYNFRQKCCGGEEAHTLPDAEDMFPVILTVGEIIRDK